MLRTPHEMVSKMLGASTVWSVQPPSALAGEDGGGQTCRHDSTKMPMIAMLKTFMGQFSLTAGRGPAVGFGALSCVAGSADRAGRPGQ